MTSDQREVLDFLAEEWKIRLVKQGWLLKESGKISSYARIPGGEPMLIVNHHILFSLAGKASQLRLGGCPLVRRK